MFPFENPIILGVMTYIGIFVSIYLWFKKPHKKICYKTFSNNVLLMRLSLISVHMKGNMLDFPLIL